MEIIANSFRKRKFIRRAALTASRVICLFRGERNSMLKRPEVASPCFPNFDFDFNF
jgi:hypothetical protein